MSNQDGPAFRVLIRALAAITALSVIAAVALWISNRHRETPPGELPEAASSPSPELSRMAPPLPERAPPRAFRPAPPPTSAVPGAPSPYAMKPEGNIIEFEVVNGLAIAYGDVLLGKPDPNTPVTRGHYEAPTPQIWPRPRIPYAISPTLPNPARVEKALQYFRENAGIDFVPYQNERDALVFEPGEEHCYSYLGRVGGLQPVKLSPGCQWTEIAHEIMHALGFVHEQSRTDRDQYIRVQWENIEEKFRPQFAIVPESFMEPLRGTPFDFQSVMLYSPTTFATRAGNPTFVPLNQKDAARPVQEGLSEGDLARLRRLYRPWTEAGGGER